MRETPAAVRMGSIESTYDEVARRASAVGSALQRAGVAAGDRVALVLRNDPAFVELSLGIGLAGAVPVPVNWHWRGSELAHILHDSSSRVVFAHRDLVADVVRAAPPDAMVVEVPPPDDAEDADGASAGSTGGTTVPLDELLQGDGSPPQPPAAPPMSMIYTSGTTGAPKGILREPLAPDAAAAMVAAVCRIFGMDASSSVLIPAPLYHTAPNVHSVVATRLRLDQTLMARFDAEEMLRLIEAHRITQVQVVPIMFVRLLELPDATRRRYDLSSLQSVVHAAAPCSPHVKQAMIDWFGPIISEYYGASETGPVTWCTSDEWLAHPGSVGHPDDGSAVRILGPDGAILGPGEVGAVHLKPAAYWPDFTYLNDPGKRREIDRDGYLNVGDVGYVDADGYLFLTDRSSDIINSGGVNIYAAEIEEVISRHPDVADVAVIGIPDDAYGEAVAAHVVLRPGADADHEMIRAHVREHLASYKTPKSVVFESALPREDSGKLFKRRIRDRYWAGRSSAI